MDTFLKLNMNNSRLERGMQPKRGDQCPCIHGMHTRPFRSRETSSLLTSQNFSSSRSPPPPSTPGSTYVSAWKCSSTSSNSVCCAAESASSGGGLASFDGMCGGGGRGSQTGFSSASGVTDMVCVQYGIRTASERDRQTASWVRARHGDGPMRRMCALRLTVSYVIRATVALRTSRKG